MATTRFWKIEGVPESFTAAWFTTTGTLVWLARADAVVVERNELIGTPGGPVATNRVPLADVVGVEVHHWRMVSKYYATTALRLREAQELR